MWEEARWVEKRQCKMRRNIETGEEQEWEESWITFQKEKKEKKRQEQMRREDTRWEESRRNEKRQEAVKQKNQGEKRRERQNRKADPRWEETLQKKDDEANRAQAKKWKTRRDKNGKDHSKCEEVRRGGTKREKIRERETDLGQHLKES